MTGKELKQLAAAIPDDAVVLVNGSSVAVVSLGLDSPDLHGTVPTANISMVSVTPPPKRPFHDAETR